MNILFTAADAFDNPNSPAYYIVGCIFLALVFAALAVYIIVSKKLAKKAADKQNDGRSATEQAEAEPNKETETIVAEADENTNADGKTDGVIEEKKLADDETPSAAAENENTESVITTRDESEDGAENNKEEIPNEYKTTEEITVTEDKQESAVVSPTEQAENAKDSAAKTENASEKTATTQQKKPAQPKKSRTTAQKTFIDRLIADKSVHAIYNELKNTILSYPGVKAKLTKDEEQFVFGTDKKAAVALKTEGIELYLNVDHSAVPSAFGVKKSETGDLPTVLTVTESNIDAANKAVTFAMNVSMLTKNDRRRRIDYIAKAIEAKDRAKKK